MIKALLMRQIRRIGLIGLLLFAFSAPAQNAEKIIEKSGIHGGLIVVVGCKDADLLADLRTDDKVVVVGLDTDTAAVAQARAALVAKGVYGPVTVMEWDGGKLPFTESLVNLCVQRSTFRVQEEEIRRVLAPGGVSLIINQQSSISNPFTKPVPDGLDEWSHIFHDASNNAWSRDTVVGPPKGIRWWAGPYSERSHNWVNGTAAMVTSSGRLFYIHDKGPIAAMPQRSSNMGWAHSKAEIPEFPDRWALFARDAFNGVVLWEFPLEGFGNLNFEAIGNQPTSWNVWSSPLSLNRRVVATPAIVYATPAYRGGLNALDAETGEVIWEYNPEGHVDEIICDGERLFLRVRGEIPHKRDFPFSKEAREKKWMKAYGPEDFKKYIEEQPPETLAALDAKTGKEIWTVKSPRISTETLCAHSNRVLYFDFNDVVCLSADNGKEIWRNSGKKKMSHGGMYGRTGHTGLTFMWKDKAYFAGGDGTTCYNLETGEHIWNQPRAGYGWGFGHPTGFRIVDGIIYNDNLQRWDARTGEEMGMLVDTLALGGTHGRCHRGVATTKYIMGIRFGVEFYDIEQQKLVADCRWLRSACALGYLPANGLVYHTPDPCACWVGARVRGYHAFEPTVPDVNYDTVNPATRHQTGPAYAEKSSIINHQSSISKAWPTYRHDPERSGRASTVIPAELEQQWVVDLSSVAGPAGRTAVQGLTPPVVAGGSVFVSRKDANEIVCLDASSGKVQWRYQTAAFVDTPPTVVETTSNAQRPTPNVQDQKQTTDNKQQTTMLCVFGCADGYVYALRASDGALAWRFRAAPADVLAMHDQRPASKWPSHGAVLVKDDSVYCTAGNSSFLDGGINIYKLDAASGNMRGHTRVEGPFYDPYKLNPFYPPETNKWGNVTKVPDGYFPSYCDIEGARSDILVSDGVDLHMGQTRITTDLQTYSSLREHAAGKMTGRRWLRPMNGFLDDTYFHRVGWHYTAQYTGGANVSGAPNAGKLLVFDDTHSYAADWEGNVNDRYPNHLVGGGTLMVCDKVTTEGEQKGFVVYPDEKPVWQESVPLVVRAMILAPSEKADEKRLYVAGPLELKEGEDRWAPYQGLGEGHLYVMAAKDGRKIAEMNMPAQPVFDGMAAAHGKLYIALTDGQVVCLGGTK